MICAWVTAGKHHQLTVSGRHVPLLQPTESLMEQPSQLLDKLIPSCTWSPCLRHVRHAYHIHPLTDPSKRQNHELTRMRMRMHSRCMHAAFTGQPTAEAEARGLIVSYEGHR